MGKNLQQSMDELIREHGIEAVREAYALAFRRMALADVADKFNLWPYSGESVKTEGREN